MKRLFLLLVIIVVAVVLAFMSLPEDPGRVAEQPAPAQAPQQQKRPSAEDQQEAEQAAIEAERDKRLEAMKVEYARLEKARRNLRQRLQAITYYMGQAEGIPTDETQSIRDEIGAANRLLINPPLLGAFRSVDGIRQELEKINRINKQLDEYQAIIREHGGYDDA